MTNLIPLFALMLAAAPVAAADREATAAATATSTSTSTSTVNKEIVVAPDAPKAVGPYSQGVKANGMVFVAGQLPLDPKTGALVQGGVEAQTERVMENVKAILAASGLTFANVVMSNCYLTNMEDFAKFNAVYAKYFPSAPPARATVGISKLAKDAQVEVAVIAVR